MPKYKVPDAIVPHSRIVREKTTKTDKAIDKQKEMTQTVVEHHELAKVVIKHLEAKIAHYKTTDALTKEDFKNPEKLTRTLLANKIVAKELQTIKNGLEVVIRDRK